MLKFQSQLATSRDVRIGEWPSSLLWRTIITFGNKQIRISRVFIIRTTANSQMRVRIIHRGMGMGCRLSQPHGSSSFSVMKRDDERYLVRAGNSANHMGYLYGRDWITLLTFDARARDDIQHHPSTSTFWWWFHTKVCVGKFPVAADRQL